MKLAPLRIYTILIFTLSLILLLSGCTKADPAKEQESFDEFTLDLFVDEVQSDSLSMNYTLSNPQAFGIDSFTPTFGTYTKEDFDKDLVLTENYISALKKFDFKSLSNEQQITYDVLINTLQRNLDSADFYLYQENLSPTIGLQAQLPILLAEFNFYSKADIEHYLDLLPHITEYYQQIIDFEKQKAEAGLFMPDYAVDDIINQCEAFIADPDECMLLDTFSDRLKASKDLTKEERKDYEARNYAAVSEYVIPAYQLLIDGLKQLKGSGKNEDGLSHYPEGKNYYEYLVSTITGSDRTMTDIKKLLEKAIKSSIVSIQSIYSDNPNILDMVDNVTYPASDSPENALAYLENAIIENFPALPATNYQVKYVHPSLEENLSPAFFLTPALDNWENLSIYINGSPKYESSDRFPTLAHEGYPGHLYQTVYFNTVNPSPIRHLLGFGGYTEGWATYVEMQSYHMAALDQHVATLLEKNNIATLAIASRLDIGIHYDGWDLERATRYLKQYGLVDSEEAAESIYRSLIEEPANYLQYTVGYLEFVELRNKAEKTLGDDFRLKDFHQFVLDMGPSPFSVLEKYMNTWMKKK